MLRRRVAAPILVIFLSTEESFSYKQKSPSVCEASRPMGRAALCNLPLV
jgi:hypothetical protein